MEIVNGHKTYAPSIMKEMKIKIRRYYLTYFMMAYHANIRKQMLGMI